MDLQKYLVNKFKSWQPPEPEVVTRNKGDITLDWTPGEPFGFLGNHLLYKLEKNNKIPKWIVVYSGGKTTKKIDYLAPRHPHRFRLKVIIKAEAVPRLADMALAHYGDDITIYEKMGKINNEIIENNEIKVDSEKNSDNRSNCEVNIDTNSHGDTEEGPVQTDLQNEVQTVKLISGLKKTNSEKPKWIESKWSVETWTSTDTDGTSPVCFCMAVKCGYLKEVQVMLDERPDLIGIVNTTNGFTPLATAVRKGDINIVRLLLTLGAEIDQPSSAGQTPLHIAVLDGDISIAELLIEKGANIQARDWNGLRAEHFAVDSCNLDMLNYILDNGGDIHARDYNGWTPLFRALCQGAKTAIIEELMKRGSNVDAIDNAGLPLTSVAKLLKNRHGRSRASIMRLVDCNYPHEKALANFTRLTKKIYNVTTLLKM